MIHDALGPGPEFDRIRAIAARLADRAGSLGDDCALVPAAPGLLALSTDVSVEGVHFRREWLTLEEIGWRAASAALSDLAAEGADPVGLLAAVTCPRTATDRDVAALMGGVGDAVAAVGGRVLGGDLSSSIEWSVAVTVIGRADRPVTRRGASAGDGIWVTGALGGARAALVAWQDGRVPHADARRAFAHPEPRVQAGRWLAAHAARAMIDLSDGLGGDAGHLAAASGVALDIDLASVPVAAAAVAEAKRLGVAPAVFAAEGGEDYELLVALPSDFGADEVEKFRAASGVPLTRIGTVAAGAGVRFGLDGKQITLRGFDHFR